ncbi:hypothetical protein [Dolichospermum sp. UHCC 0259]|uniref:hypothetical protein n=1 Tax=Dolichospermum sp. UHCC 0259 TaxID=2590010 RepID=UPI0020C303F5|nr:hypothetical protein [Dolichospermum sp. UHCC 0259]
MNFLLDSNIVSYALKKNITINNKLKELSFLGSEIFISCITYYEIKRGLISLNATKQLVDFHGFCNDYPVLFLDDLEIIEKSCEIHAKLKSKGTPIQDADVLTIAKHSAGIAQISVMVICPVNRVVLESAFKSGLADFEDAVQIFVQSSKD